MYNTWIFIRYVEQVEITRKQKSCYAWDNYGLNV